MFLRSTSFRGLLHPARLARDQVIAGSCRVSEWKPGCMARMRARRCGRSRGGVPRPRTAGPNCWPRPRWCRARERVEHRSRPRAGEDARPGSALAEGGEMRFERLGVATFRRYVCCGFRAHRSYAAIHAGFGSRARAARQCGHRVDVVAGGSTAVSAMPSPSSSNARFRQPAEQVLCAFVQRSRTDSGIGLELTQMMSCRRYQPSAPARRPPSTECRSGLFC